jgi:hypothetical protein
MRRIAPVTFTLLTLALAPALHAQSRSHDPYQDGRWDRGRYDNRDGRSYGRDDRYGYPESARMERIAWLAHEVDETATYIHRKFERNNRRPDWQEARAADALHNLNFAARRFHDQVESYRRSPRYTVDEYARLEQAFYGVAQAMRRINERPYVSQGMERIYVLMNEIARSYGRRGGYGAWSTYDRDSRGWGNYRNGDGRYGRDGRYGSGYGEHGSYGQGGYGQGGYDQGGYDDEDVYVEPQSPHPH